MNTSSMKKLLFLMLVASVCFGQSNRTAQLSDTVSNTTVWKNVILPGPTEGDFGIDVVNNSSAANYIGIALAVVDTVAVDTAGRSGYFEVRGGCSMHFGTSTRKIWYKVTKGTSVDLAIIRTDK